MVQRKLPEKFDETTYVEGFLHTLMSNGAKLDYGYSVNHVPTTSGQARAMISSFDLAKQSAAAD